MSSARFWLFSPIFSVMEENGFKYTMFALSSLCRLIQHSSTFFLVKTLSLTVFLCVTYRRQWHLCHVIPLNKGESTGLVQANYSLPKVCSPGKKLRLDNFKLELVENRHFATPNLVVACVSQEILHLAPSFFTGLHLTTGKPRNHEDGVLTIQILVHPVNCCSKVVTFWLILALLYSSRTFPLLEITNDASVLCVST